MDKKLMYVGAGIIFMGFLFGLIPSQGGTGTTGTTYTHTVSNTATTVYLTPTTKTATVTLTYTNDQSGTAKSTTTEVVTRTVPYTITMSQTQIVPTTVTTTVKQIETRVLTYLQDVTQTFGTTMFTTSTFTQNVYGGNVLLINANDFGGWKQIQVSDTNYQWIAITGKPSGQATITVSAIDPPRPDYLISLGGTYTPPELSFQNVKLIAVVADSSGRAMLQDINVKEGYMVYPSNYVASGEPAKIDKVYPRIKISGISANGTLTKINGTPDEFEVRPGVTQLNVLLDTDPVTMNPRLAAQSIWGGGGSGSYISVSTIVIGSIVLVYAGLKKGRVDG